MRDAMTRINAARGGEDLILKIGIHEGPCLAVTLNNRQDYFGQTVNMAARVQGLASSRAIFVTQPVAEDAKTAKILERSGLQPAMQRAALRGIADETTVYMNSLIASGARSLISAASRSRPRTRDRPMPSPNPDQPPSPDKIFPVSWDQFHRDSRALAWRLAGAGPFEAIVCITRGGLVPAAIVARELGVRLIDTVCVASYSHTSQGELKVLKDVAASIVARSGGEGAGVLIVDDLVDTGQTAKVVRAMLPRAHFATVYAKPMGRPLVDTFITEVSQDTWIYFPWDTGLAFQPPIRDAGL